MSRTTGDGNGLWRKNNTVSGEVSQGSIEALTVYVVKGRLIQPKVSDTRLSEAGLEVGRYDPAQSARKALTSPELFPVQS